MWHGSAVLDGRRIILQFYDSSKRTRWMSEEAARLDLVAQEYAYDDLLSVSVKYHMTSISYNRSIRWTGYSNSVKWLASG